MGKSNEKRANSLPALWYLEQTLKLRATKLSKEDERFLRESKLDLILPSLRWLLVLYLCFDILLVVEDAVRHRSLAAYIGRIFVTEAFLITNFIFTFLPLRRSKFFSFFTYLCMLVQSASTALYLYKSSTSEHPPISPFLTMDIFVLFLFVRIHIGATIVCSILAVIINEVIVVSVAHPTVIEIGNIVLYLVCVALALIASYIFELNFRSKYFLGKEIAKDRGAVAGEREKSEKLLYNILPRAIADSMKNDFLDKEDREANNDIIADAFEDTTIAFCDICDFTVISGEMNPEKLVSFLNDIFSAFDNLVHEFGLEKIKTIGDAYMFVGGLSKTPFIQTKHGSYSPAEAVAEMALLMQDAVDVVSKKLGFGIKVRVGINSGGVVAGIVGLSKFVYDVFGESVNLSAKMESSGAPKRVHVSHATYMRLVDKYDFEPAQDVEVKDKFIKTYFLLGRKGHMRAPAVSAAAVVPAGVANNLRDFLSDKIDANADFSPAKPSKAGLSASRPTSPMAQLDLSVSSPALPHAMDQVVPINASGASDGAFDGDAVIYSRPKVIDSNPYDPSEASAAANGKPAEKQPVRAGPIYPTIFAKSSSLASLDRPPSTSSNPRNPPDGVLRNRGSFASSNNGSSKLEEAFDEMDIVTPDLRIADLLAFNSRELEVRYRKDYYRKYFRLVQLNALGSLGIYIILGALDLVTLTSIDYGVLLAFGAAALVIAAIVFTYFAGDDSRAYMHYLPVIQSSLAGIAILVLAIITLKRDDGYQHHLLAWDSTIVMITFTFVFSGIPFLHVFTGTAPIVLAIIISVIVVNRTVAFQIIIRLLMVWSVGAVVSYRQEKESRSAYFVTQTMDDERRKLVAERQKSERLLYAILPQKIATKLKMNEGSIADTFYDVTVMFVSIHNFTSLTSSLNHFEQVSLLNKIFSKFDKLTEHHKLEKIKTIGATYLVVGGLPVPKANHLSSIAELALDMQEAISQFRAPNGEKYKIKAGIHCGKVVAGVIGIYKFSYDLWGDTVNTASRMESHSLPGQIQATETCQKKLASRFEFSDRGFIQVKGKGVMHTFFLTRQIKDKPKLLSSISSERLPNVVVPERGNFSD